MSFEFSFMEDISELTMRCYKEMRGAEARLEQTKCSETMNTDSFLQTFGYLKAKVMDQRECRAQELFCLFLFSGGTNLELQHA